MSLKDAILCSVEGGNEAELERLISSFKSSDEEYRLVGIYHDLARCNNQALSIHAAKALLSAEPISRLDEIGQSPLHVACQAGYAEFVRFLIEEGKLDVECRDDLGWTPLCHCKAAGFDSLANVLVTQYKANASVLDEKEFAGSLCDEGTEFSDLSYLYEVIGISQESIAAMHRYHNLDDLLMARYDDLPGEVPVGDRARIVEAIDRFHAHYWGFDSMPEIDDSTVDVSLSCALRQVQWIRSSLVRHNADFNVPESFASTVDAAIQKCQALKDGLTSPSATPTPKPISLTERAANIIKQITESLSALNS